MELTWLAVSPILLVGSYAVVQRVQRSRFVVWMVLCASLFALSTRDLFRSREQARPGTSPSSDETAPSNDASKRATRRPTDRTDDDDRERPPFAGVLRRVTSWLS